jgi:hypothetical protein
LVVIVIIIIIYIYYLHNGICKSRIYSEKLGDIQKEIKLCKKDDIQCMKNIFYGYNEKNLWHDITQKCNICNF